MNRLPDSERRSALAGLDSHVEKAITGMEKRQTERQMSERDRKKLVRMREKNAERKGGKVTYDLPAKLKRKVATLAKRNHTTASGLAALALARLLDDIDAGRVKLTDYLQPVNNTKYDWIIRLAEYED